MSFGHPWTPTTSLCSVAKNYCRQCHVGCHVAAARGSVGSACPPRPGACCTSVVSVCSGLLSAWSPSPQLFCSSSKSGPSENECIMRQKAGFYTQQSDENRSAHAQLLAGQSSEHARRTDQSDVTVCMTSWPIRGQRARARIHRRPARADAHYPIQVAT